MDSEDATKYFEIHEEADVRHAQVWERDLQRIPVERHEAAINAYQITPSTEHAALIRSMKVYVGGMSC